MNIFFLTILCLWLQKPADSFLPVVPSATRELKSRTKVAHNPIVIQPSRFIFSLSLSPGDNEEDSDGQWATRLRSVFIGIWPLAISVFIAINFFQGCWPTALAEVPFSTLSFVHAVSGMLFAGCIITTTVLERMVVESGNTPTQRLWFDKVPVVEEWIVLPALTGAIVSGIGQACARYGSFQMAPFHIQCAIFLLLAFGLWWGLTDRPTQAKARSALENSLGEEQPAIFQLRQISNIISCLFLIILYGVMVLKPGYY